MTTEVGVTGAVQDCALRDGRYWDEVLESLTGWRKKLAPTGFEIVRAKGEKPSLVGFSGI